MNPLLRESMAKAMANMNNTDDDYEGAFKMLAQKYHDLNRSAAREFRLTQKVSYIHKGRSYEGPIENINKDGKIKFRYGQFGTFSVGAESLKRQMAQMAK